MCGRYVVSSTPQQLALDFDAVLGIEDYPPDYNVAPTKPVPAVAVRGGQRVLSTLRWGLIPFWAKDPGIGAKMINARVETAAEKPAFREAFARRRCLLPADGYYEWLALPATPDAKGRAKPAKQPYYIRRADGGRLALAGLYERWRDPEGRELWSVSILTAAAAEPYAWIHDRMPLTVPREGWETWLDPDLADPQEARAVLDFEPRWTAATVSDLVNSVRNNGPELVQAVSAGSREPGMGGPGALF
jgi:putative SOS response-associated peptidase YedK